MPDRRPGRVRVLFVIGSLEVGGAEKQLIEIALGLDRARFAAAVCCLSERGPLAPMLEEGGIPVIEIGIRSISQAGVLAALGGLPVRLAQFFRAVRNFQPDVVHGMLFHAYVLGALGGAVAGVPVVVASRRSLAHFKRGRVHFQLAERLANRFTDCIVANSQAVREDTLEAERLPKHAVLVIHNGIEAARYASQPGRAYRRQLGLGEGPVAIVVANFIHYKGHQYLIDAWSRVCREHADAVVLLVGSGPLRSQIEADVTARGLSACVRFLGTRSDVPDLLAAADLLVHPSLEEGFSNALLEAMASGLPVVATAVGGNPEAVSASITGYLVPPRDSDALADAVLRVFAAPDRGRRMGEAGRQRVLDRFQLSGMIRQYEDLYVSLLQKQDGSQQHVRYSGTH